jgi:hypothetical protein
MSLKNLAEWMKSQCTCLITAWYHATKRSHKVYSNEEQSWYSNFSIWAAPKAHLLCCKIYVDAWEVKHHIFFWKLTMPTSIFFRFANQRDIMHPCKEYPKSNPSTSWETTSLSYK